MYKDDLNSIWTFLEIFSAYFLIFGILAFWIYFGIKTYNEYKDEQKLKEQRQKLMEESYEG
jgi:hypothetical protein